MEKLLILLTNESLSHLHGEIAQAVLAIFRKLGRDSPDLSEKVRAFLSANFLF